MKPIFFPHTFMPSSAAAAIRAFFPAVAVYQPVPGPLPEAMQTLVNKGFLEVAEGSPGEAPERPAKLIRELELWGGRHHQGTGLQPALLHERRGDALASELTAAIRRRASRSSDERTDLLTAAKVFLHFAQEFDARSHESEVALDRLEIRQAELFAALRGEAPPAATAAARTQPDDGADYLLERRIEAWARLFLSRPLSGPVFVAYRPEILEILRIRFPMIRRLASHEIPAAGLPSPQPGAELPSRLEALASGSEPPARPELPDRIGPEAQGPTGNLPTIHLVPGLPPVAFFRRLLPDDPAVQSPPSVGGTWRHTVIVQAG